MKNWPLIRFIQTFLLLFIIDDFALTSCVVYYLLDLVKGFWT